MSALILSPLLLIYNLSPRCLEGGTDDAFLFLAVKPCSRLLKSILIPSTVSAWYITFTPSFKYSLIKVSSHYSNNHSSNHHRVLHLSPHPSSLIYSSFILDNSVSFPVYLSCVMLICACCSQPLPGSNTHPFLKLIFAWFFRTQLR
jgi:hypothetical protein